jgi:hypothetical protein
MLAAGLVFVGAVTGGQAGVAVERPSDYAVPMQIPLGWFVLGARVSRPDPGGGVPYYARDASRGPALSGGSMSCDEGCGPVLAGEERELPNLPMEGARLTRNGDRTRVTWVSRHNNDVNHFVAARDLTDREVIAAARAARTRGGSFRGIEAQGLPAGFRELGRFGVGASGTPWAKAQITLISSDGKTTIDVFTYATGKAGRAAQRFWSEEAPLLSGSVRRTVFVERGDRVIVALGEDTGMLRDLARSVVEVDQQAWESFRARVAALPVGTMLPGIASLPNHVVMDGTTEGVRWAAVF